MEVNLPEFNPIRIYSCWSLDTFQWIPVNHSIEWGVKYERVAIPPNMSNIVSMKELRTIYKSVVLGLLLLRRNSIRNATEP